MRTTQPQGLNGWAHEFISGEKIFSHREQVIKTYPDGTRIITKEKDVYKSSVISRKYDCYIGMFEEEYPLFEHIFPNGDKCYEFEQTCPWDSGPCIFLALKDQNDIVIKQSLWTQEEQEEASGTTGFTPRLTVKDIETGNIIENYQNDTNPLEI